MREIFSLRFFAAVGVVVGLFFVLTVIFAAEEAIDGGGGDEDPTTEIRRIDLVDEHKFTLNSPRPAEIRGGSVVFDFVGSADIARELNRRKFFCDHRPGAGIRVGPHFYTKDEEIDGFFAELIKIRG